LSFEFLQLHIDFIMLQFIQILNRGEKQPKCKSSEKKDLSSLNIFTLRKDTVWFWSMFLWKWQYKGHLYEKYNRRSIKLLLTFSVWL